MHSPSTKRATEVLTKAHDEAFALYPNVGLWAVSYHRRVAHILEALYGAFPRGNAPIYALAEWAANTSKARGISEAVAVAFAESSPKDAGQALEDAERDARS